MRKMDQEEFDGQTFVKNPRDCGHPDVVRLIDGATGAHMDYGCTVCGLQHTNSEVFKKHGLEGCV